MKQYRINGSERVTVGRSSNNDIIVNDKNASSVHAIIERSANQYYIIDNSSTNGTFVNGKKVTKQKLSQGDKIVIGSETIGVDVDVLNLSENINIPVHHQSRNIPQEPIFTLLQTTTIGRETSCNIVINDGTVSRHHIMITKQNKQYILTDNHSTAGTIVNNQKVSSCALSDGADIQIGNQHIYYGNGMLFSHPIRPIDIQKKSFKIKNKKLFAALVASVLVVALALTGVFSYFTPQRSASKCGKTSVEEVPSLVDLAFASPYYYLDMGLPGNLSEQADQYMSSVTRDSLDAADRIIKSYNKLDKEIQKSYGLINEIVQEYDYSFATNYRSTLLPDMRDFVDKYSVAITHKIDYESKVVENYGHAYVNSWKIAMKISAALKAGEYIDKSYLALANISADIINTIGYTGVASIDKKVAKLDKLYSKTKCYDDLLTISDCTNAIDVMVQYLSMAQTELALENLYYARSLAPSIDQNFEYIKSQNRYNQTDLDELDKQIKVLELIVADTIPYLEERLSSVSVEANNVITYNVFDDNTSLLTHAYAADQARYFGNSVDVGQMVKSTKAASSISIWNSIKNKAERSIKSTQNIIGYAADTMGLGVYYLTRKYDALKASRLDNRQDLYIEAQKDIDNEIKKYQQRFADGTSGQKIFGDASKGFSEFAKGGGQFVGESLHTAVHLPLHLSNHFLGTDYAGLNSGKKGTWSYNVGNFVGTIATRSLTNIGMGVSKLCNSSSTWGDLAAGAFQVYSGYNLGTKWAQRGSEVYVKLQNQGLLTTIKDGFTGLKELFGKGAKYIALDTPFLALSVATPTIVEAALNEKEKKKAVKVLDDMIYGNDGVFDIGKDNAEGILANGIKLAVDYMAGDGKYEQNTNTDGQQQVQTNTSTSTPTSTPTPIPSPNNPTQNVGDYTIECENEMPKIGEKITFTVEGVEGGTYRWYFDDNQETIYDGINSIELCYYEQGYHYPYVEVFDSYGNLLGKATIDILVEYYNFELSCLAAELNIGEPINFEVLAHDMDTTDMDTVFSPISIEWNTDDGNITSGHSTYSYTYDDVGDYTVSVDVIQMIDGMDRVLLGQADCDIQVVQQAFMLYASKTDVVVGEVVTFSVEPAYSDLYYSWYIDKQTYAGVGWSAIDFPYIDAEVKKDTVTVEVYGKEGLVPNIAPIYRASIDIYIEDAEPDPEYPSPEPSTVPEPPYEGGMKWVLYDEKSEDFSGESESSLKTFVFTPTSQTMVITVLKDDDKSQIGLKDTGVISWEGLKDTLNEGEPYELNISGNITKETSANVFNQVLVIRAIQVDSSGYIPNISIVESTGNTKFNKAFAIDLKHTPAEAKIEIEMPRYNGTGDAAFIIRFSDIYDDSYYDYYYKLE